MYSKFALLLVFVCVSFGCSAIHVSVCLCVCIPCVWVFVFLHGCVNTSACVCVRVCVGWLRSRPCCLSPCWVTKAKPRSLAHIHWGITSTAKPPLASEVVVEGWGASEGKRIGGMDMNSTLTNTPVGWDSPSKASCTPRFPDLLPTRWWREIDQLRVFPQNENRWEY